MRIAMDLEGLKQSLSDAGCCSESAEDIIMMCEAGNMEGALRMMRKDRCRLMEDMHRCGRKIDLLDTLIRTAEEKMKETDPLFIGR